MPSRSGISPSRRRSRAPRCFLLPTMPASSPASACTSRAAGIWGEEAAMTLKALLSRLFGSAAVEAEPIEYNGYRIRPTPYPRGGGYQTCGIIEKELAGDTKQHRFV